MRDTQRLCLKLTGHRRIPRGVPADMIGSALLDYCRIGGKWLAIVAVGYPTGHDQFGVPFWKDAASFRLINMGKRPFRNGAWVR